MALETTLRNVKKIIFEKVLRPQFFPNSPTLTLQRVHPSENEYESLGTVTEWFFEETDEGIELEIAEHSTDLTARMEEATHISIDDDYYFIADRNVVPPQGTSFTWKLTCTRVARKQQFANLS